MSDQIVLKWVMFGPDQTTFKMPKDAKVIEVASQNGTPTLWTLSETGPAKVERSFVAYGTGHIISEAELTYVGTAHDVADAGLVFHIFERAT